MTEPGKADPGAPSAGGSGQGSVRTDQPSPGTSTGSQAAGSRSEGKRDLDEMTMGELAFEVTDRATVLVREEIELAKTEVSEKVNRLIRGSVVGLAAGIFAVLALILLMHSIAWAITDAFFADSPWTGFLIEGVFFILVAIGAGLFARRSFRDSAPPVPEMAIEQAKEIKAEFEERSSGSRSTGGDR